jgi:PDZ domain-containing protein
VAIFTAGANQRPRNGRRGRRVGWVILLLAMVGIVIFGLTPAPYAIESPGPVFNTLGTTSVNGQTVPVLSITGHPTHPTSGALDMLTVNLDGDPSSSPSWVEIASAWFDPSEAVVPLNELFAPQETVKQSNAESTAEMTESQQSATAAALYEQGIKFTTTITVTGVIKGSPAVGVLKTGDIVTSVNGTVPVDATQLHNTVVANGFAKPLTIDIVRAGKAQTVKVTPTEGPTDNPGPIVGIYLGEKFDFPFQVKIQLQDVGGPSAGQMFALGIIDKLTDGHLNGGKHVAGTGTITASGDVGAIGGIRQKMYGAKAAGATYFLAPASNCGGSDGVRGHIPAGLTVFATSTLKQSVADLQAIAKGGDLSSLQTCDTK